MSACSLWLAVILVVLGIAGYFYLRSCIAEPPSLPADLAITKLALEERDGRVYLGKNWFGERDGLRVLRSAVGLLLPGQQLHR
jgi:hypothetical protein